MPIIVQNINNINKTPVTKKNITPKYLNDKLTGNGKTKVGFINRTNNTLADWSDIYSGSQYNKAEKVIQVEYLEDLILGSETANREKLVKNINIEYHNIASLDLFNENDSLYTKLGDIGFNHELYYGIKIDSIYIDKDKKIVNAGFKQEFIIANKTKTPERIKVLKTGSLLPHEYINLDYIPSDMKLVIIDSTHNSINAIKNLLKIINSNNVPSMTRSLTIFTQLNYLNIKQISVTPSQELNDYSSKMYEYLKTKSVYKILTYQAEKHSKNIIEKFEYLISQDLENMKKVITEKDRLEYITEYQLKKSIKIINRFTDKIKDFDQSLDLNNRLYQVISKNLNGLDPTIMENICDQSIEMQLAKHLFQMKKIKENNELFQFNHDPSVKSLFMQNNEYNPAQKNVITSEEPLILVRAGAGTGKTHTVKGRLDYLKSQKINMKNVLVLSFTNAAADTVRSRYPNISSETIATMIHNIYKLNFPTHRLSNPETLKNSLELNPTNMNQSDKNAFIHKLDRFVPRGFQQLDVKKAYQKVNSFVSKNMDIVINLLDEVEQTTLELEQIIVYNKLKNNINSLKIPKEYQNIKIIVTDESQDISTFEYIFILKLVEIYKCQLIVVGDASQTLYEFRNSDPKYMNELEKSNIFKNFNLETNYRSKQSILNYANKFLEIIDANKYSNIQLKSNNFQNPNLQDLEKAVNLKNINIEGANYNYENEFKDYLKANEREISEWIIEKLKNKEQIGVLSYTKKDNNTLKKFIENLLAKRNVNAKEVSLISENKKPSTIMSDIFIQDKAVFHTLNKNADIDTQIRLICERSINRNSWSKSKKTNPKIKIVQYKLNILFNNPNYIKSKAMFANGNLTTDGFVKILSDIIIKEEIKEATMNNILNKRDTPDTEDADIIYSTIHSAKGREFDNTIVLYNNLTSYSHTQETMRLYFVALSRAKKSELIFNLYKNRGSMSMSTDPMNGAYKLSELELKKNP